MDILEPELLWIEDRCYRVSEESTICLENKFAIYEEETYEPDDFNCDEVCDEAIEIEVYRGNLYKHSFNINSSFYKFIIGSKAETIKRLKQNTNTQIIVPKRGQEGNIEIIGNNKKDIIAARYQVDLIIESSRNKIFTHFVSIPVNTESVKEAVKKFKVNCLQLFGNDKEFIENVFMSLEKLHLTIIMLNLYTEDDYKKATNALEACNNNIIKPFLMKSGPITIRLEDIEYMNDDPTTVTVLYVKPHSESDYLQKLMDKIAGYFFDLGLSNEKFSQVKLHMSVMCTRNSMQSNPKYYKPFDATNILKNHKNTYFGQLNLSTINIAEVKSTADNGYYKTISSINLLDI